jgi:hypothetical protein
LKKNKDCLKKNNDYLKKNNDYLKKIMIIWKKILKNHLTVLNLKKIISVGKLKLK